MKYHRTPKLQEFAGEHLLLFIFGLEYFVIVEILIAGHRFTFDKQPTKSH